jgi:hypothetical protein
MRTRKQTVSKTSKLPKKRKTAKIVEETFFGLEHDFVIITGGGFLVIVLAVMLFFGQH